MANNRVCLGLLRIYRSVPLSRDELDLHEIIIPFWSLIREEPRHLRGALLSQSGTRRAVSAREKRKDNLLSDWVGSVLSRQPVPEESLDMDVLHQLAVGLVFDRPAFQPLSDA